MGGGARYFTILRDPVELFISLWDYAGFSAHYRMSLEDYALNADKRSPFYRDRGFITNLGRNQMMWDFGVKPRFFDDAAKVKEIIEAFEAEFELVLIAEKFDESIILLRDLLCWTFQDLTYLKLNARKSAAKSVISDRARAALKGWMKADYALYEHFNRAFERRLLDFGEDRMNREKRILRTANENVRERCSVKSASNDQLEGDFKLWGGKELVGYKVDEKADDFCKYYGINEMSFIDELRERQTERMAQEPNMLSPFMSPLKMMKPDGSPDLELLAKHFRSPKN